MFESLLLEHKQHKTLALQNSRVGQNVCVLIAHTQDHDFPSFVPS